MPIHLKWSIKYPLTPFEPPFNPLLTFFSLQLYNNQTYSHPNYHALAHHALQLSDNEMPIVSLPNGNLNGYQRIQETLFTDTPSPVLAPPEHFQTSGDARAEPLLMNHSNGRINFLNSFVFEDVRCAVDLLYSF